MNQRILVLGLFLALLACQPEFSQDDLETAISQNDLTLLIRMRSFQPISAKSDSALKEYFRFVQENGVTTDAIETYHRHIPAIQAILLARLKGTDKKMVLDSLELLQLFSDYEKLIQSASFGTLDQEDLVNTLLPEVRSLEQRTKNNRVHGKAVQVIQKLSLSPVRE